MKTKMKRLTTLFILVLVIMSSVSGCGTGTSAQQSEGAVSQNPGPKDETPQSSGDATEVKAKDDGDGTLTLVVKSDIDTLNPHIYKSSSNRELFQMIGGTLYKIMPAQSEAGYVIGCEMAEEDPVMMDNDGKLWQIKVRDDAKWANGEPLTAEDYVYSLKMLYDPLLLNHRESVLEESNIFIKNASKYFSQKADGNDVPWEDVGIRLKEGNIIELELEKAVNSASIKKCFSGSTTMPVYKELYEAGMNEDRTETNYGTSVDKQVSSGPYKMKSWEKGAEYTAEKNTEYVLKDDIYLSQINYKIISEAGTSMQMFESGKLDYISLTSSDLERYGEDARIMAIPQSSVNCVGIDVISTTKPILGSKKFRQALFYGVNREEIASITQGLPAAFFITNEYVADITEGLMYRDSEEVKSTEIENYGYDPEKAKKLFGEALEEEGIDKVSLELIYHDGSDSRKSISEYLQKAYAELFGSDKIELKLQAVPSSQLSEKLRAHVTDPNSFELGWIASSYNLLDPLSALLEWHKDTHRKKIPYYDDEFSAMYDEIAALPLDDTEGRLKLTAKAERKLLDDAPFIPLFQPVGYVLISDRVELPTAKYNSVLEYGWIWARINE